MQKQRFRQLLIVFSLFMLLVLPTAIVGYSNFSTLVNKAFGKPFKKDDGAFTIQTESSANISKGSQFSLKVTSSTAKTIPFKDFAAFIEFDKTKVDIKSVITQNQNQFKIVAFQNGYLVYPATMVKPTQYTDLLPQTCHDAKTCDFTAFSTNSVSFSINGILLSDLTEQQRPIKITLLGASEASSVYLWNEKVLLPGLSLGSYIKNAAPKFTSDPVTYSKVGSEYRYTVTTTDADQDPVTLSLTCPELVFCNKQQVPPAGLVLEGSDLVWASPKAQKEPYTITVYANDGKSVTTQTFNVRILAADTSYFACTFTPAVSVKILDFRIETPLVIVAESSEKLASAAVTLSKDGAKEKELDYTFAATPTSVIVDQSSNPSLSYQFSEGTYTGTAIFKSTTGESFTCELNNPTVSMIDLVRQAFQQTVQTFIDKVYAAVTVGTNHPPTFTSDPMLPAASGGSSPSVSFVYGNAYAFTLRAQDPDGDPLQYTVVTKPSWAQLSVSATNPTSGASSLDIQITGVPQAKDAGSNLFSFSVNDGLGHYITRTWVVNINYPNNDIPRVTILQPKAAISRIQGQPFLLGWDADDRQQLMSFGVYYTKSLSSSAMTAYNKNVAYNVRSMTINTKSIPPGDYYFVVTATDGFNPPATGRDYTTLVRIVAAPKPTPTPKPTVTPKPTGTSTVTPTPTVTTTVTPAPTDVTPAPDELSMQVTSPQNQAQIAAADFQIVATFTASSKGTLDKKDVSVFLDGTDISASMVFQPATGKSITGTYLPKTLLDVGVHELTIGAQDSQKKSKEVHVTFTIKDSNADNGTTVSLFGFDVPKQLYTIFIIAIVLIAIALLLPIIMYFAFRRSNSEPVTRRPVNPQPPQTLNPQLRTPTLGFAGTSMSPPRPVATQQPQFSPVMTTPIIPVSSAPQQQYQPPRPFAAPTTPVEPVTVQRPVEPTPIRIEPKIPATAPQITPEQAMQSFVAQASATAQKPTETAHTPVNISTPAIPHMSQQTVAPPKPQPMPVQPSLAKEVTVPKNLPPELRNSQGPATVPSKTAVPMPQTRPTSTPANVPAKQTASIPPESPSIPK